MVSCVGKSRVEVPQYVALVAILSLVSKVDDLWNLDLLSEEYIIDVLELLLEVLGHFLEL